MVWAKKRGKGNSKAFGFNNSTTTLPFTEMTNTVGGTHFRMDYQQFSITHGNFDMPINIWFAIKYTNL